MTVEKIEVVGGHIIRVPVDWKIIPHCAGEVRIGDRKEGNGKPLCRYSR